MLIVALAGATKTTAEAPTHAPRNLGNYRTRSQRLFNDPRLVVVQKPPAPASSRDHLHPAHNLRLRLKHMVKLRHKPISHSEISTFALCHPRQ
jgi:hypothetical protein